jgi:hypothetical protein
VGILLLDGQGIPVYQEKRSLQQHTVTGNQVIEQDRVVALHLDSKWTDMHWYQAFQSLG